MKILHQLIAKDNQQALDFLILWATYCHEVDDIIDNKINDPEKILRVFVTAAEVYNHPFYVRYQSYLYSLVIVISNAYADSVKWSHSMVDAQHKMSDVLRHAGNDMLFAVAFICGGYEHLRTVSSTLREQSWLNHHDDKGNSI